MRFKCHLLASVALYLIPVLAQACDFRTVDWGWPWDNVGTEEVAACLEAGADPNVRDEFNETPLSTALRSTSANEDAPAIIELLVSAGASLETPVSADFTPLKYAALSLNSPEIVRILINAGADLHARNEHGVTILHMAPRFETTASIVERLVEAGADIHARIGLSGVTPLAHAVQPGQLAIVELLLEAGSDPNSRGIQDIPPAQAYASSPWSAVSGPGNRNCAARSGSQLASAH